MADVAQGLSEGEEDLLQYSFTHPDDRAVDSWLFMSSPVPVLSILLSYLAFVYYGPMFMEHRKPFKLRYVLIAYNFTVVIISSYVIFLVFGDVSCAKYVCKHLFIPMVRPKSPHMYQINFCIWLYAVSKIIELADTVFFILRKKYNQVTFLHVYHHVNMVLTTWVFVKYIRAEQGLVLGLQNSCVHVIMYSYYLLAAFGPRVQKYLWWKKYITKLQLGQFVVVLLYSAALLIYDSKISKGFTYYSLLEGVTFLALFSNFYRKTYTKDKGTSNLKDS